MKMKVTPVIAVVLAITSVGFIVRHLNHVEATSSDIQPVASKDRTIQKNTHGQSPSVVVPRESSAGGVEATVKEAPSVDDLTESFRALPTDELKEKLEDLARKIEGEEWVERANRGALTAEGMGQLEELLNTEAAAKIVLLERDLARVKGKYL